MRIWSELSKPGVPLVPVLDSETPDELLSQPQKLRIGDGKQKYYLPQAQVRSRPTRNL